MIFLAIALVMISISPQLGINNKAEKKFYFINLETSTNRAESMYKQSALYNLNIIRIDAVNGYKIIIEDPVTRTIHRGYDIKQNPRLLTLGKKYNVFCDPNDYTKKQPPDFVHTSGNLKRNYFEGGYSVIVGGGHRGILSSGELGLLCSSRKLWKEVANSKTDQIAIIFEDDAVLVENFDKKIAKVFESLPKKWDILYLGFNAWYTPQEYQTQYSRMKNINKEIYAGGKEDTFWGAYGYAINKNSAKKLLLYQEKFNFLPLDALFLLLIREKDLLAITTSEQLVLIDRKAGSTLQDMGRINEGVKPLEDNSQEDLLSTIIKPASTLNHLTSNIV